MVVAYNNYHYESLHPVDDQDRQETIRLVQSYMQNRYNQEYGFTKNDIKYLISPSMTIEIPPKAIIINQANDALRTIGKHEEPNIKDNAEQQNVGETELLANEKILEESVQYWTEVKNKQKQTAKKVKLELKAKIDESKTEHITKTVNTDRFLFVKGKFRFEELQNGKIQCGGCKEEYTRILGHLNKNNSCSTHIDINEFKAYWTKFSGRKRVNKCSKKKRRE